MTTTPAGPPGEDRNMRPVYVAVIALEALVLTGIWLFQRYFGT